MKCLLFVLIAYFLHSLGRYIPDDRDTGTGRFPSCCNTFRRSDRVMGHTGWPLVRREQNKTLIKNNKSIITIHWDCYWSQMTNPSTRAHIHYNDVIMSTTASPQITSPTIVYSTLYAGEDQRKHQSSASLAFVQGIHRDRWIPRTNGQ